MISSVRNIASNNPDAEVWKYLRLFLNPERTAKQIREIHKIEADKYVRNIEKQAIQIGHCIRQAEEYFRASADVGLATKPLLLYYGAVALSRALILLKKDGTYSLDGMRKAKRHRHHGLVLNEGHAEEAGKAKTAEDFFSALRCSFFLKEGGLPWGHFPLFYESLDASVFVQHVTVREFDRETLMERDMPCVCADALNVDQLKSMDFATLELLKSLPDLFRDLNELGIGTHLARGNVSRDYVQYFTIVNSSIGDGSVQLGPPETNRQLAHIIDTHNFFVDGLLEDAKEPFWEFLQKKNPNIAKVGEFPNNLHLRLTVQAATSEKVVLGYYPDIIDDINGKKFYILRPDKYIHESGALLAIMYCLGMLSRYYPDIWMRIIDKNVDVVEVTNSLLSVAIRKFPNLVLDQMSGSKHFIHL
jgi:hypothetical protein